MTFKILFQLYLQSRLRIALNSWRSFPNMILRRFLGTHAMWYLYSQTVWGKLLSFGSVAGSAPPYPTTMSFFIKYYSIAFATLPDIAGA
jgi:hypothetical protein